MSRVAQRWLRIAEREVRRFAWLPTGIASGGTIIIEYSFNDKELEENPNLSSELAWFRAFSDVSEISRAIWRWEEIFLSIDDVKLASREDNTGLVVQLSFAATLSRGFWATLANHWRGTLNTGFSEQAVEKDISDEKLERIDEGGDDTQLGKVVGYISPRG